MKLQKIVRLLLCFALLTQSTFAFETDQFNLPDEPLADIGVEVSDYAERNVQEAVEKVNAEIRAIQSCSVDETLNTANEKCRLSDKEKKKLARLRSENAVAKAVFNELGTGIFPLRRRIGGSNGTNLKPSPRVLRRVFRNQFI